MLNNDCYPSSASTQTTAPSSPLSQTNLNLSTEQNAPATYVNDRMVDEEQLQGNVQEQKLLVEVQVRPNK